MDTEFHLMKSGHARIGKFCQVKKSEEKFQEHMKRKTDKQGPKSDFIQCLLSNHMPSMST